MNRISVLVVMILLAAAVLWLASGVRMTTGRARTINGKTRIEVKRACPCDSGKIVKRWKLG